jgi:N-carbamoylputrescine amidase
MIYFTNNPYKIEKEGIPMRKIKIGALQPGGLPFPSRFDYLSEDFCADTDEIIQSYTLPLLGNTLRLLESCADEGCDLALTSEAICGMGWYIIGDGDFFTALLKKSAPEVEARIADAAKKRGMYIAACYFKRIKDKNYNVTSIFNPNGEIAGEYRKTHLPPCETWQITPGEELNIIDLPFAKVGVAICYDMMFPECVSALALSGAELILHPTAGYGWYDAIGEATLRTRANDHAVPIVTAKNYSFNGAGHSSIIDHWGLVLADAGFYENVIVTHTLDLDKPKTQPAWYNPSWMSGQPNVKLRHLAERRTGLYGSLTVPPSRPFTPPDEGARNKIREAIKKGECKW